MYSKKVFAMRPRKMRRICVVGLLLAVGCGAPRSGTGTQSNVNRYVMANRFLSVSNEATVHTELVQAPAEQVWTVLPQVYEELGIEWNIDDPTRMQLGNPRFRQRQIDGENLSKFLDCGSGVGMISYADTYIVTMSLTTAVDDGTDGGAVVQTAFQAVAKPRAVSGNELRCTSKGTLERRITDIIAERVVADTAQKDLIPA